MLLLGVEATVSLGCGCAYLLNHHSSSGALAFSVMALPMTTMWLAIFTNAQYTSLATPRYSTSRLYRLKNTLVRNGGITHSTLPYIAAYSLIPTVLITIVTAILPKVAETALLTSTSLVVVITLAASLRAGQRRRVVARGAIRLVSPCPSPLPSQATSFISEKHGKVSPAPSQDEMEAMRDRTSWISSPSELLSSIPHQA